MKKKATYYIIKINDDLVTLMRVRSLGLVQVQRWAWKGCLFRPFLNTTKSLALLTLIGNSCGN
jgi:hypothetical protein